MGECFWDLVLDRHLVNSSNSCYCYHESLQYLFDNVCIGAYVSNRVSDKLTPVHDRIYCCRSGSAADTQYVSDVVKLYLDLHWYVTRYLFLIFDKKIFSRA